MARHSALAALLCLAGSLFASGCAMTGSAANPPSLDGTAWVLAAASGAARPAGDSPTLRFDAGRAAGSDGCNRYTIGYSAQGDSLRFPTPGAGTRMACPPEVMRRADAFMQSLAAVRTYRMREGRLEMLGADGALIASFAPQTTTLAGTQWRATAINNGNGGVESLAEGSEVTLAFAADGRFSGASGCNRYTGSFTSSGESLQFGPAAGTRRMCADERVMRQEAAYLKALEGVATARIEGDRLELRSSAGALMATFGRDGG
jgi:heat shock protein HslJ